MSVGDVREAFDQGEFMLDGPTLCFGGLLGPGNLSASGRRMKERMSDILVNLLGGSSLLQGDLLDIVLSRITG